MISRKIDYFWEKVRLINLFILMKTEVELMTEKNQQEYAGFYDELNFITPEQIIEASKERSSRLESIEDSVQWGFNQSKLDCKNISTGCKLCGEGSWSCLFINGVCNANCFYCPAEQKDESVPTTNTIEFPTVEDYIAYIKKFGFKGVSISGGEPLLTFEKSLAYIEAVRNEIGPAIYIWMYTNGKLATKEKLVKLKNAGLNEIRFDLSAVDYKLDALKLAVGVIDHVTVEIPSIPEDFEQLTQLIKDLKAIGIDFLNLHQIRCTPFNFKKLIKRGYTFLHGPKIVVLESELTALRLIQYNIESKINFPINYCSFIYKYRYQNRAARIRHAREISNACDEITKTGLIRTLNVKDTPERINHLVDIIKRQHKDPNLWSVNYHKDTLTFHSCLWDLVTKENLTIEINYYSTGLCPSISYHYPFKEIKLNGRKKIYIEKGLTHKVFLENDLKQKVFERFFIQSLNCGLSKEKLIGEMLEMGIDKTDKDDYINLFTNVFDFELLDYGLYPYY
ncbi:MAG TPA: radical SAM protein [Bacteroidales bacterium]|nr:radical SAM protein [Bacteroidales bacterium]